MCIICIITSPLINTDAPEESQILPGDALETEINLNFMCSHFTWKLINNFHSNWSHTPVSHQVCPTKKSATKLSDLFQIISEDESSHSHCSVIFILNWREKISLLRVPHHSLIFFSERIPVLLINLMISIIHWIFISIILNDLWFNFPRRLNMVNSCLFYWARSRWTLLRTWRIPRVV